MERNLNNKIKILPIFTFRKLFERTEYRHNFDLNPIKPYFFFRVARLKYSNHDIQDIHSLNYYIIYFFLNDF